MTAKTFPSSAALADARTQARFWKERAEYLAAMEKKEKLDAAMAKSAARREREAAAIAKAQLKLQKLLDKQTGLVGVKALKANRKPSKVTTTGAEDNAIAAALVAKRVQPELF
jgi:hypothetical protein